MSAIIQRETFFHIPSLRFLLFRKQRDCSSFEKRRAFSLHAEIHISIMRVGFLAQTAQSGCEAIRAGREIIGRDLERSEQVL